MIRQSIQKETEQRKSIVAKEKKDKLKKSNVDIRKKNFEKIEKIKA